MIKKIFRAVLTYLKDWKNLLMHALIGVAILCVALFLPVHPAIRIGILLLVVAFNVVRMLLEKRAKKAKADAT